MKPYSSIPGSSVVKSATPVMHMATKTAMKRFLTPARSAMAPRTGALRATIKAESETARPHNASPSPASFPTIVSMK